MILHVCVIFFFTLAILCVQQLSSPVLCSTHRQIDAQRKLQASFLWHACINFENYLMPFTVLRWNASIRGRELHIYVIFFLTFAILCVQQLSYPVLCSMHRQRNGNCKPRFFQHDAHLLLFALITWSGCAPPLVCVDCAGMATIFHVPKTMPLRRTVASCMRIT